MSIRELQPSSLLLSGRAPRRKIQKSGVQFLGGNSELFSSSYACEKNEEHLCIFDDRAGKKRSFSTFLLSLQKQLNVPKQDKLGIDLKNTGELSNFVESVCLL